ncbi:cyclic peptide export ABC transporter [Rhizobium leguminosarum]|uniref:cyclic peptide export ABC transporter n=1 Tax=Rhizobium TaxID=379 RepID=UPI001031EF12|nr:cyclic peptide export ABC transporter [Rhizobium leguminosarum]TBF87452.1 cyclic peptide export ABC transporter [Rhizobium leguminosarum]TBG07063.1 cyclic peptide export ABC transporter [Rhizobium leguminosarum]TBG07785.1 cyclic peptide export ABC transporter [Rhizobium leguminosarum]TBG30754.1 cyclic peptide export ABC transporter [Rhizobium leguminosarum]TBG50084.1 cyclic peptide export ABC transporter [Rhizobium leguminosarum]
MQHLIFLGRQSWTLLVFALLSSLLAGSSIAGTMTILDWGIREPSQWRKVCLVLLVACALQFAMQIMSTRLLLTVSHSALLELRLQLCRRILASPQEALQKIGKARLLAVLTHDATTLVNAYQAAIIFIRSLVVIALAVLYLATISWVFAAVTAGTLSIGMVLIHYLTTVLTPQLVRLRESVDNLYVYLKQLTDGTKELQLNEQRSKHLIDVIINSVAGQISNQSISALSRFEAVSSFGEIIYFLGVGMTLFLLPQLSFVSQNDVGSVAIVLLFMSTSISTALQLLPSLGSARTSLDKIELLTKELPTDVETPAAPTRKTVRPERFDLKLEKIKYVYAWDLDRQFQFGPIDLNLRSGEIVFVVGGNGSGKSTLAMLVTGLYTATSGQITLNGISLTNEDRHQYRQNFSAIFSDFHLFDYFAEENGELSSQVPPLLDKLSLSKKVTADGSRFSTVDLSAGQRKRLALLHAYLEDRPCFIFDEWAADQDPDFRRFFYRQLLPELKARGKAIIAVTHDDAYFDCADRILRLEDGKMTAEYVAPADRDKIAEEKLS